MKLNPHIPLKLNTKKLIEYFALDIHPTDSCEFVFDAFFPQAYRIANGNGKKWIVDSANYERLEPDLMILEPETTEVPSIASVLNPVNVIKNEQVNTINNPSIKSESINTGDDITQEILNIVNSEMNAKKVNLGQRRPGRPINSKTVNFGPKKAGNPHIKK